VRVVSDVVSDLRGRYAEADLSTSFEGSTRVAATPDIGEAIRELIRNAVTHSDRDRPSIRVEVRDDGGHTVVRVVDDGPGIDRQETKILRSDAKIGPVYHGSGLGLWLVREIVRQSDGTLRFHENASGGTTVTIRLSRE
jgi:signal transduction histidine kinase